jgi:lipoic acid synthetase
MGIIVDRKPSEQKAPDWLRYKGQTLTKKFSVIRSSVNKSNIATVCEAASCPNRTECWSGGTATFLLMGDICTRGCKFCNIKTSRTPPLLDPNEPVNLVRAILDWETDLNYIVLTSVDRDDLVDGGSNHLAECIRAVQKEHENINIEILIPDFQGKAEDIQNIINAKPQVIAHNIEVIRRLTPKVRDRRANYDQSLEVLRKIKELDNSILTKSSIMVGLSEKPSEVIETMQDLRDIDVDFLTIGQYMRPNLKSLAVREYVSLEQFEEYERIGNEMGFKYIVSKPLVRSSYRAGEYYISQFLK